MQLLTQSAPIIGGTGVWVGSGVGVSGAGVEVGLPAATVSVGAGVLVFVEVAGAVQVACGAGSVAFGTGPIPKVLTYNVTMVTQTVPMTPISAAMIAGSILLFVDIIFPIRGFFHLYPTKVSLTLYKPRRDALSSVP